MNGKKNVIVTGAAGFAGANLVIHLLEHGYEVFAQVRSVSPHNVRMSEIDNGALHVFPLNIEEMTRFPDEIQERYPELWDEDDKFDCWYHMLWGGGRDDFESQNINITGALHAVEAASELGCRRIVFAGSQAECGPTREVQTEKFMPMPVTSYGSAKAATMYLTRNLAVKLDIEWVWGRIFSLIGLYEPDGRMLPDLVHRSIRGEEMELSSCNQNWNFLDAGDAAEAFIALGERGTSGAIYNVASDDTRPLRYFIEDVGKFLEANGAKMKVTYGEDPVPFVSLQPDITRIMQDTGWKPEIPFEKSLDNYL